MKSIKLFLSIFLISSFTLFSSLFIFSFVEKDNYIVNDNQQNLILGQITNFGNTDRLATMLTFEYGYIQSGTNSSRVQYSLTTQANWITLDNPDITNNIYDFTISNLVPETEYEVFLRVIDINTGETSTPVSTTGTTLNGCGIIDLITVVSTTFNSIEFSYWYTAGDGNSQIYYGYEENFNEDWILLNKLDKTGAHQFTIFNLEANTEYSIYIRTKNTNCLSNFWDVTGTTENTSRVTIPYSKITNITSTSITIDILIQFNGLNATLYYTLDNTITEIKILNINQGNSPFIFTYEITGLTPSTEYEVMLILEDDTSLLRSSFIPQGGELLKTLPSGSWIYILSWTLIGVLISSIIISGIYIYLRKRKKI